MLLILKLKMMIICRECNVEIDTNSGYPEHELMNHANHYANHNVINSKTKNDDYM